MLVGIFEPGIKLASDGIVEVVGSVGEGVEGADDGKDLGERVDPADDTGDTEDSFFFEDVR